MYVWLKEVLTFLLLMSAYWCKNFVFNFKKHRELKTYSAGLLNCETKMNSKDKTFLGKFCVKESSILTGLEDFETSEFSIKFGLWWSSPPPPFPHQSKNDDIFTH